MNDPRTGTVEYRAGLLRAGQLATVASASDTRVFRGRYRSVRCHHLSVHVASRAYGTALTSRSWDRIRARCVTVKSRLCDHSSLASEDSARIASLGPLGLRSVVHSIAHATFALVAAFVLTWLQQRVATLDARALLLPAFDEAVLAQAIETPGVRNLVHGEIFSLDVACLSASYYALRCVATANYRGKESQGQR